MSDTGRPAMSARRTKNTGPWPLWGVLTLLLWSTGTLALSPDKKLVDLRHTAWGAKEGAPGISALAQTSDGYLWIRSDSGSLFRFDGLRFEHIELPGDDRLSSKIVYQLFAPNTGGLWIGFTFGGAAFLKDGHMTVYTEHDGLPPGTVESFAEASDGTLWAATTGGLAHLGVSGWRYLAIDSQCKAVTTHVTVDSQGTVWLTCPDKVFFLPKGEQALQALNEHVDSNSSIAESPSGDLWLLDQSGIRSIRTYDNRGGHAVNPRSGLLIDRNGTIWLRNFPGGLRRFVPSQGLAAHGLTRWQDMTDLFTAKDGMTSDNGQWDMVEDREGNVWIGTERGLDRFSEPQLVRLPVTEEGRAAIEAADGGGIWAARTSGSTPDPSPISSIENDSLVTRGPALRISCVLRVDDGSVWFGGEKGLLRHVAGRFESVSLPAVAQARPVQAMAQDRTGRLWVSIMRNPVFSMRQGAWAVYGDLPTLPKLTAVTLSTDASGRVWFGYTDNLIAIVDGSNVQLFSAKDGLQVGNVTAIYGRRSRVWAGGEFGLALFDGKHFQPMIPDASLRFENITGIVESTDGDLWLHSNSGLIHIVATEVRRGIKEPGTPLHGETFGPLDGLEGFSDPVRPHPSLIEGTDERLWISTDLGIFRIDPKHIARNPVAPPVQIKSVSVGDKTFLAAVNLMLPEHTTALRVRYEGVSLTMPEKIRYRYKLDGVNPDWQDAQTETEAYFTNLGPGSYHFHVIAANNDGLWNNAGATLDLVIPPAFTQTPWFIALSIFASAALLAFAFRLRVHQITAKMRLRLDERLRERERIARELHDTLLQSTQGLMLRVQAARNRILPNDPARELLDSALKRADEVLAEGRDRVQDLRIPQEARSDLAISLEDVGKELALGRTIEFQVTIEGTARKLRAKIVEETYSIGREALVNAFHHAQATTIELLIVYGTRDLRVTVRDDGCGMDSDTLDQGSRAGHWGLKGMRERAHEIGAHLKIRSGPGAGTEVDVLVPSAFVWVRRPLALWWFRFLRARREPH
jgi:signal transduction histidine kinase/ligand-binding sensor domain-containing protein